MVLPLGEFLIDGTMRLTFMESEAYSPEYEFSCRHDNNMIIRVSDTDVREAGGLIVALEMEIRDRRSKGMLGS